MWDRPPACPTSRPPLPAEPHISERAAFISAILDNLDDTPRLVFADWLQEHGEETRAEFIRCQIEAARHARSRARKGAAALLQENGNAWLQALGLPPNSGEYSRGFLVQVLLFPQDFDGRLRRVLVVEPATFNLHLQARDDEELISLTTIDSFAADSRLRAATKITSQSGGWGGERFARLLNSQHLVNLRSISLFEDVIGLEGVQAIVESPSPFTLEVLDLNSALQFDDMIGECDDTHAAIRLIASSSRFASLKRLSLMFNELSDESIQALIDSKTLPRTLHIELEDNDYDEEAFAEALAERFTGGSDGGEE